MLPKIPYKMEKNKSQIVQFRGINYSDMRSDGDLSDSFGISLRRYPYLTNKRGREVELTLKSDIKSFAIYGGKFLCTDAENNIYYDGTRIGVSSESSLNFATVGNKVVIYPDKSYVDFAGNTPEIKELESEMSGNVMFGGSSLTFTGRAATPYTVANATITKTETETGAITTYSLNVPKRNVERKCEGENYICVLKYDGKFQLYRARMYDLKTWFNDDGKLCAYAEGFPFKAGDYAIVYDVSTEGCQNTYISSLSSETDAYGKEYYKINLNNWWNHTQDGYILLGRSYNEMGVAGSVALEITRYGYTKQETAYGVISITNKLVTFDKATVSDEVDLSPGIFHGKITNAGLRAKFNTYLDKGRAVTLNIGGEKYLCTVVDASTYSFDFTSESDLGLTFKSDESGLLKASVAWITITADAEDGLDNYFSVGDCVEVSGSKYNDTSFVIDKIDGQVLYASAEIFNTETETENVTVARRVPELDFICENHNRLFGCSNKDKTIYVSSLGDPTNMYAYEGVATDSFAVAVPGEGDFTACVRHDTSVLFFKEDKIYKLAGSYPAEFALYSYEVPGVQAGSEKSCVLINEVLYYKGVRGIYAYDGSIPVLISECFGERRFYNACAGSDGVNYYVSMNDDPDSEKGSWYLFAYDTQKGIWMLEEKGIRVVGSARISNELYFLRDDGKIYHENAKSDVTDSAWLVRFAPIYELIDGKRCYSRILARVSLPRGSYIIVKIRCDGGEWREAGKIVGKTEAVVPIRIPINRCDKFELELSGRGECTILDIMREFHVGSEM